MHLLGGFLDTGAINEREQSAGMKLGRAGYIDRDTCPQCSSLNGETRLEPVLSERLAFFRTAFRRCAKPWLRQLSPGTHREIAGQGLPKQYLKLTAQDMTVGERQGQWHTDVADNVADPPAAGNRRAAGEGSPHLGD